MLWQQLGWPKTVVACWITTTTTTKKTSLNLLLSSVKLMGAADTGDDFLLVQHIVKLLKLLHYFYVVICYIVAIKILFIATLKILHTVYLHVQLSCHLQCIWACERSLCSLFLENNHDDVAGVTSKEIMKIMFFRGISGPFKLLNMLSMNSFWKDL